jgi:hypothetical protein
MSLSQFESTLQDVTEVTRHCTWCVQVSVAKAQITSPTERRQILCLNCKDVETVGQFIGL